jgi:sugar/nucleoside kinase (ribokinase family)
MRTIAPLPEQALQSADVVKLSVEELAVLTGDRGWRRSLR